MNKVITIGKEGDQPFNIKQEGVSREHARLTIDDNGQWMLEDLGSSNGTFIRNEKGELDQIARKTITEDSYICLGPDNANGCQFYARQLVTPKDYHKEFDYLEDLDLCIDEGLEKADERSKMIRKAIALISGVGLVASFIVSNNDIRTLLLRISTAATMASTMFYDPAKAKKSLEAKRTKFFGCPNPACSHTLTSKEVKNRRCSKCKIIG